MFLCSNTINSCFIRSALKSLHIGPGATALTLIPLSARDNASERVSATIAPFVGCCLLIKGDLKNPEIARDCVQKTIERFGGLDILVNNHAFQKVISDSTTYPAVTAGDDSDFPLQLPALPVTFGNRDGLHNILHAGLPVLMLRRKRVRHFLARCLWRDVFGITAVNPVVVHKLFRKR